MKSKADKERGQRTHIGWHVYKILQFFAVNEDRPLEAVVDVSVEHLVPHVCHFRIRRPEPLLRRKSDGGKPKLVIELPDT